MNKFARTGVNLAICMAIIFLAGWLPKALFDRNPVSSAPGQTIATDKESPVTMPEKVRYLQRFISHAETFIKNDVVAASAEQMTEAKYRIFNFITEMNIPGFLSNELEVSFNEAVVETFSVETKGGAALKVQNVHLESWSDWSNWINLYIDEDTGKVLYFYASGSGNGNSLVDDTKYLQGISADELCNNFAAYSGYSIGTTSPIVNDHENAIQATYYMENEAVQYKINCIYHPGMMYDFKFEPLP